MRKNISRYLSIILCVFFLGTIQVQASEFSLNEQKLTINIGDTYDLDAIDSKKEPVWTSYNENIVKVDKDGVVTAQRIGTTKIKARVGFTYKTCSVKVVNSSIKLNKKTAIIYIGGNSSNTMQLKAKVKGASAIVEWASEDENIAIVDNTGKVTSVGEGTTNIMATANGKSALCQVTVKKSDISLNLSSMQLSTKGNGSSIKLIPSIVGSKKNVRWTTSDKNIATVSNGKVTGKNEGIATITATANGISAACKVMVVNDLISINEEKILLYIGESRILKTNAGKKDIVNWNSSNETVATIENGKVQAVGEGIAIITVQSNGKSDTCEVRVKNTTTSIAEDTISLRTKGTDKTYKLNTNLIGRKNSIKWTTSDKSVATVSGGKITAKKAGTATITATANGVSDSMIVTVADYIPTIKLNQSNYTLYTQKGNTMTLKAVVDGKSKNITWNSSNTNVATVTNKGKVVAVGEGNTIISATANGVTDECVVTVKESKVILEKGNIHLEKGEKESIPVDIVGKSQNIKWISTNNKVVNVKNGVVTAKNYGEADIKVTANGVTSICHINVSKCTHKFDDGVVTKEPTCTEEGAKSYTCSICGYSYTESISIIEHNWGEWGITKEASETEVGEQKHYCIVCGKEETKILPMLEHSHKYEPTIVVPTCTEDGYTNYVCTCGDNYKKDIVPAIGHSWGEWVVIKEATETETGEQKHICSVCEAEETRNIPELSHTHKYEPTIVDPTCTEDGYTNYICVCGDNYKQDIVSPMGHSWGEWVTIKEASETEMGEQKHICNVCEAEETESLPMLEHSHKYEPTIVAPTCTEDGYTTYACTCGDNYNSDYVGATGHSWGEWIVIKEASETEMGEQKHICNVCEAEETESLPMLEHTHKYEPTIVAPTCTEDGYTTYACTCGDNYKEDIVLPIGHSWGEWVTTKEATETEIGEQKHICSVCEAEETEEIPMLEHTHKYEPTIVEPTCIEDGYTTYICACGDNYNSDFVSALGHIESDWIIDTEPTCIECGWKHIECTICYEVLNGESIDALEHDIPNDWTVTKKTTCTESGWREIKCTRCDYIQNGESIDALGHSYDDGTSVTLVTCTTDGEILYTCLGCGETKTETIKATGHTYGHIVETLAPTDFETFGSANMICPDCNETLFSNLTAVKVDLGDGNSETMYGYYDYDEAKTCFDLTLEYIKTHSTTFTTIETDDEGNVIFDENGKPKKITVTVPCYDEERGFIWNEDAYNFACIRTAEMGYELNKNGNATHKRPNGNSLECGENLATRMTTAKDPQNIEWTSEEVFQAWLHSSGHRDNIEGGYEQMASVKFKCWLPDWECWSVCWVQNFY